MAWPLKNYLAVMIMPIKLTAHVYQAPGRWYPGCQSGTEAGKKITTPA